MESSGVPIDTEGGRIDTGYIEVAGVQTPRQPDEFRVRQVELLRKEGNDAFSSNRFDQAISSYSACLKLAVDKQEEATLLSNRSAAFSSLCQQYRSRPAERSEQSALFGMDPTHLAQLALKDAKKAVQLRPGWTKALSRQGLALFLLERYDEAEESYLSGLSLDPTNQALQDGLREVGHLKATLEGEAPVKRQRVLTSQALDDSECTLCFKLLFEPVTTSCGHSFCRGCFSRAVDHSNRCPLCRTVLHTGRDLPISVTLATLIERSFATEYADRRAESLGEAMEGPVAAGAEAAAAVPLPLFVMSTLLPGEKMALNIFEPRYRLMARRCMEGNRRFGMAQVSRNRTLEDVACEVEILDCSLLPDGCAKGLPGSMTNVGAGVHLVSRFFEITAWRYYLEVVGQRRVRLGETWELDGYRMARVIPITDTVPEAGTPQMEELVSLAAEVNVLSSTWVERLRTFARQIGREPERLREFLAKAGQKPSVGRHESLSFWVASLLVNFLPELDHEDRPRLMRMTTTTERLSWLRDLLSGRTSEGSNPCAVM